MPHEIPEKFAEVLIGGVVAVMGFFTQRTLSQYDRRILKTEEKQDKILTTLAHIDKRVVEISTKIEYMREK